MVNRFVHVIDNAIGDNEQNLELLVAVAAWISLTHIVHGVKDGAKVRWTIQVDVAVIDAVLVVIYNVIEIVHSWIEDVSVHREAVRSNLGIWSDTTSEAEKIDLLIGVVVLKNTTDGVDNLQVLVLIHVEVMKRFWVVWRAIGKREVNSN